VQDKDTRTEYHYSENVLLNSYSFPQGNLGSEEEEASRKLAD
jgi:hypothetical protein